MTIAGLFMRMASRSSANRFEKATLDPVQAQQDKLLQILQANKSTEYGQKHGFASIRSIREYQEQVPVVDYEDIRSEVERMVKGESGVLTSEIPVMFAQTSGTTGDPKYIPVTPTCEGRDHRDVMRTWLWHASNAHPGMFSGKVTSLVSPAVEGITPAGIPFGSTSGMMYQNIPWIVRRSYSIPYEAFEIEQYQSKYYVIMRTAIEQPVTFLCTANPSSILKLCEKGNEFAENIIRDIHDGALSSEYELDEESRSILTRHYKPNPKCARHLEKMRSKRNGKLKPCDYWQNLALIGCWKGGTVGHYVSEFDSWFRGDDSPSVPVRDWGYLASEMRGSVPLSDDDSAGVLAVATNVYEFVAVEQVESSPDDMTSWDFLTVADVEKGKEYYIFATTTGGLYRYDINDVVRVERYYNKTPQICFLRKGRGMTNLTGEKVSVNQVIEAIAGASEATGADARHFKVELDEVNARYLVRVEFDRKHSEETQSNFLRGFEEHLRKINLEYKAKRDSQRLRPPVLYVMREGWYERNRRELAQSGRRMFQAKTEVLSPVKIQTQVIQHELDNIVEYEDK